MEQYVIAARNFKTTYNFWPGDFPRSDFGCPGNGDGTISWLFTGPYCNYQEAEGEAFFVHLSKAGFIPQTLDYGTTNESTVAVAGASVPGGPDKGSIFVVQDAENLWNNDVTANARCLGMCTARTAGQQAQGTSYLFYSAQQGSSYPNDTRFLVNILTPADALAIDQKIDDGMPNSGNVIGSTGDLPNSSEPTGSKGTCGSDPGGSIWDTVSFQPGQPYNITSPYQTCVLGWRISDDFVP